LIALRKDIFTLKAILTFSSPLAGEYGNFCIEIALGSNHSDHLSEIKYYFDISGCNAAAAFHIGAC